MLFACDYERWRYLHFFCCQCCQSLSRLLK